MILAQNPQTPNILTSVHYVLVPDAQRLSEQFLTIYSQAIFQYYL